MWKSKTKIPRTKDRLILIVQNSCGRFIRQGFFQKTGNQKGRFYCLSDEGEARPILDEIILWIEEQKLMSAAINGGYDE